MSVEKSLDYKEIQESFNKVIQYSQDYDFSLNTNNLFKKWITNKTPIIEKFLDGKLIKEISLNSNNIPLELINKYKEDLGQECITKLMEEIYSPYFWTFRVPDWVLELKHFLHMQGTTGIIDNKVINEYNYNLNKIPSGMKLAKALRFFVEDEDKLRIYQDLISEYIQKFKNINNSILCFSVHPLDFISISDNSNNWRSCHALDGEYRSGNLQYMVDPSTVICYLKPNQKNEKITNFPPSVGWNSKIWRVLLHFDTDFKCLIINRQYPFTFSEEFLYVIRNELVGESWGELNRLYDFDEITLETPSNTLFYNDLTCSNYYHNPYYFSKNKNGKDTSIVKLGGIVPCVHCGNDHTWLTDSFLCTDCELQMGNSEDESITQCDICGARVLTDDISYLYNNIAICPECADVEGGVVSCNNCGELHYARELNNEGLCKWCANPKPYDIIEYLHFFK